MITARQVWLVLTIAFLAGVLAFGASFLISAKYESSTQLLVRGRDTTLLSGTGEGLRDQPAVIDAALTNALSETQSALLSSRTVAEKVVDALDLDQADPQQGEGFLGRLRTTVKGLFIRAKAYITYGFYEEPDPYERAVSDVHEGLEARPRTDSYIIELTAQGATPELAAAIANEAANALVEVTQERFRDDAEAYRDFLADQVDRAAEEERRAAESVRRYKDEHGIADVALSQELGTIAQDDLKQELQNTIVNLAAATARLQVLELSLDEVGTTSSSSSRISTGRSSTNISATQANPAFQELLVQAELAEAEIASLEARQGELEEALLPAFDSLTEEEAQLRQLELQYSVASDSYRELSARHQQAVLNAENEIVEVMRVDEAGAPLFPVSPKRYLFLGLGFILGAMAGLILTFRNRPEPQELTIDLTSRSAATRQKVGRFELFAGDVREDEVP